MLDVVEFVVDLRVIVIVFGKIIYCTYRQRREVASRHPVIRVGETADIGKMTVL